MMKVHPVAAATFWVVSRAMMSVPPPGGNGTMTRIALLGHAWANAPAQTVKPIAARRKRREICMFVSGC
jgi:hypothetical protein